MHHLGVFAENTVCAFHFWEDFQGRAKTGFPVFCFFYVILVSLEPLLSNPDLKSLELLSRRRWHQT
jgi:hypothetical protein